MLYSITATIAYKRNGQIITGEVPPFILDPRVHNIMGYDHAKFIAAEIINPTRNKQIKLNINVQLVDREVWAMKPLSA